MGFRQECAVFCRTTSARGIPRVAKTVHRGLRAYWTFFTTLLFSLCLYMLLALMYAYLTYPTSTVLTEVKLEPRDLRWLPAMTICDKSPIPARKVAALENATTMSYLEFEELTKLLTKCYSSNCTMEEQTELGSVQADLLTFRGYYQFLTEAEVTNVSHSDSLILDCSLVYLSKVYREQRSPCNGIFKVTPHILPNFFTCFELSLMDNINLTPNESVTAIELVLHLDRYAPGVNHDNQPRSQSLEDVGEGVRVLFHPQGRNYTSTHDYVDVESGVMTDISVSVSERNLLSYPYGACGGYDVTEGVEVEYVRCVNALVADDCNCTLASDISTTTAGVTQRRPFCEDLHLGLDKIKSNRNCIDAIFAKDDEPCLEVRRNAPCHETRYHWSVATNTWPSTTQQSLFMDFVKNSSVYPYMYGNAAAGLDDTKLRKYIGDNFLKLRVRKGSDIMTIITDAPMFQLNALLSSIGGTLNLFCGMSIFFFLEMIECCVKVCTGAGKVADRKPPNGDEGDDTSETKVM